MALSSIQQQHHWYWVVLRHRVAAAAFACLNVDAAAAAAYSTPEGAAQIRPEYGFLLYHCPNSRGYKRFSNMLFTVRLHVMHVMQRTEL